MLQKKILSRVITSSDKNAPSIPIFDSLKVLKLNDMITMHIVSFVYECVYNLSPACFSNYFTWIKNVHSFSTRQSKRGDLFALHCNTTQYGHRSFHYSGVRLWTSLPTDMRNSVSFSIFRSKIKSYFLSKYNTTLYIYSKNPYIRTKKLRTFEAEIFCYAPSKQEPSPA